MGLLTASVGCLPKPADLVAARRALAQGDIEEAELREVEERALRDAIALQVEAGLDAIVPGTMDGDDLASFLAERIEGMEIAGIVRSHGNTFVRKARIVGDVARRAPWIVSAWTRARDLSSRPVRALLPGPYTLMDGAFDEHYTSREECATAFARVLAEEILDLAAAGAKEIQLDESSFGVRSEELPLASRVLAAAIEGVRGRVRIWVRPGAAPDENSLRALFALPVDGFLLPLATCETPDSLRALPADKLLGAGVVDGDRGDLESEAIVRERIRRILAVVPAERVWIHPDGDLAERTPEQARAKIAALVAAARSA